MGYHTKQMEYAIDRLDRYSKDIYNVNILLARRCLRSAWNDLSADNTCSCCLVTGIVPANDCDTSAAYGETVTELDMYFCFVMPHLRWLPISDLLSLDKKFEVTQLVSGADEIMNITMVYDADFDEYSDEDEDENTAVHVLWMWAW